MNKNKIEEKIKKLDLKKQKIEEKQTSLLELKENAKELSPKQLKRKERKEKNKALNAPPVLSTLEEIGNAITHGLGALLAIGGLILLVLKSDTGYKLCASLVYCLSIFFMMLSSCLYHAFRARSTVKRVFRRFDYTSIYLLIGGTFAPLLLVYLNYPLNIILFIIQWVIIVTGITLVSVFGPGRNKWIHFTLYFVIGWSGLLFIPSFIKNNINLLYYILGGGIIYTLGMIPFGVLRGKKSAHFIWHLIVLAGCITQFIGIYLYVY